MKPRSSPRYHNAIKIIDPRLSHLMLAAMLIACFAGCSSFTAGLSREKQPPPDAAAMTEALAVLSHLSHQNAGLSSFKGKGKI